VKEVILLDTGPLVALLDRRDSHHDWALEHWRSMTTPVLTCQAVIAEAAFILARGRCSHEPLLAMVERGVINPDFSLAAEAAAVSELMARYSGVPMFLADACLVRLSEIHINSCIFTLDGDFQIYRRQRRNVISLLTPPD
jgi:predicted nucleic acid-binding protein